METAVPSLDQAIEALQRLGQHPLIQASPSCQVVLGEAQRRVVRLAFSIRRLMELNDQLLAATGFSHDFDPATGEVVLRAFGKETRYRLQLADPATPAEIDSQSVLGFYNAGHGGQPHDEHARLELELEVLLEGFYHSAHRVLKLLGGLEVLQGLTCRPITIVRNQLLEHPMLGSLYTFGYGSSGPRIKPLQTGASSWTDDGLGPNTNAFVEVVVRAVDSAMTQAT